MAQLGRTLRAISKVGLVGMIVLAGWNLLLAYRELFDRPSGGDPPGISRETRPSPLDELGVRSGLGGIWSVGGSGWRLSVAALSPVEVDARSNDLGRPTPPDGARTTTEVELLRWLRGLEPEVTRPGNACVYRAELAAARIRVVTEGDSSRERIRLGQVSWSNHDGSRYLLEFSPADASPEPDRAHAPMIPLTAGAEILARRSEGDEITAELIGPVRARDRAAGGREGWSVVVAGDDARGPREVWRKGKALVLVWKFKADLADENSARYYLCLRSSPGRPPR